MPSDFAFEALLSRGEQSGSEEVKSFSLEGFSIYSKGEDGLESGIFFLFTTTKPSLFADATTWNSSLNWLGSVCIILDILKLSLLLLFFIKKLRNVKNK